MALNNESGLHIIVPLCLSPFHTSRISFVVGNILCEHFRCHIWKYAWDRLDCSMGRDESKSKEGNTSKGKYSLGEILKEIIMSTCFSYWPFLYLIICRPWGLINHKLKLDKCIHTKTCTWMFIAALFIIAKKVETTQMLIDRWRHKEHTVEYYSAIKRKRVLIHATTWMNTEDI